ncbi:hypothetical protein Prudu_012392 [Prunus dulcis]|uniref:Uncharacterized protein n=1 Tax=Prunus dulcis TaxID=3755 RepID=A0A4Y1RD90_PRUDU|nr:hypothetical protein Prudu_012392 [Prunus dulcis]
MNTLLVTIFFLKIIEKASSGLIGTTHNRAEPWLSSSHAQQHAEKWLEQRITKYGPVSKLSLFGKPTVFIHGQAANKFVFNNDGKTITSQQPESTRMILGDRNILELSGEDHKRVRNALMVFLKPESLKQYVGKLDEEIRKHLELNWHGKQKITVSYSAIKSF